MFNETVLAALFLALTGGQPAQAAESSRPAAAAPTQPPAGGTIYGSQMMTAEERDAYRAKVRSAKTQAERDRLRTEHRAEMQQRAKERGLTLAPQAGPGAGQGRPAAPGKGPQPGKGPGPGRP